MTWQEIQSSDDPILRTKQYIQNRFSERYLSKDVAGETVFQLPDGNRMRVIAMRGNGFNCLAMNYKSVTDDDDGDLFYPADFASPEEMFNRMLEETTR